MVGVNLHDFQADKSGLYFLSPYLSKRHLQRSWYMALISTHDITILCGLSCTALHLKVAICSSYRKKLAEIVQVNPEKRLGSGPSGAEEIKQHHWFTDFDWNSMLQRKMRAPMLPRLKDKLDTSNFDNFEEADLPPNAPGRTDRFTDKWEGLWDWIDDPPRKSLYWYAYIYAWNFACRPWVVSVTEMLHCY